jgi:hypothetical protein
VSSVGWPSQPRSWSAGLRRPVQQKTDRGQGVGNRPVGVRLAPRPSLLPADPYRSQPSRSSTRDVVLGTVADRPSAGGQICPAPFGGQLEDPDIGLGMPTSPETQQASTLSPTPDRSIFASWLSAIPLLTMPTRQPDARSCDRPSSISGAHRTSSGIRARNPAHNSSAGSASPKCSRTARKNSSRGPWPCPSAAFSQGTASYPSPRSTARSGWSVQGWKRLGIGVSGRNGPAVASSPRWRPGSRPLTGALRNGDRVGRLRLSLTGRPPRARGC